MTASLRQSALLAAFHHEQYIEVVAPLQRRLGTIVSAVHLCAQRWEIEPTWQDLWVEHSTGFQQICHVGPALDLGEGLVAVPKAGVVYLLYAEKCSPGLHREYSP